MALCLLPWLGCRGDPVNRVRVTETRTGRPAALHYEDFDEAYYAIGDGGLVNVILRKVVQAGADPTAEITQILHIRSYWRPFPGRTYADDSMLNANITYLIQVGGGQVSYNGGGFFQYREQGQGRVIKGTLEGGDLQPSDPSATAVVPFERVEIHGRIKATRDDRRTMRLINELRTWLDAADGRPTQRHTAPGA